jgi:hypothetical protein
MLNESIDPANLFRKYRNEAILSCIIIVLSLTLVNGTLSESNTDTDVENVKIVASELVGFEPMHYSISHRKVPEPEGVNIELETASMTMAELHTRSTNEPVIGILSNIRLGKAYNEGKEFKVLAPWYREGMGADNMTVGQLISMKDSNISEPKDLEGKKVGLQGLAGGSATAAMTALREKNVNLSKIEFVGVDENTGPLLLEEGNIAAAQVDSSVIVQENFDDKYKTAIDFGKVLHEEYGAVPPSQYVVVRKEHYEENPEKYDKAVRWLRDNYEWADENKRQISEVRSNRDEGEAAGEPVDLLMKKFTYFQRIGNVTQEDVDVMEAYFETAKMQGTIDEIPDLDRVFEVEN